MKITCAYCGKETDKASGSVNRSRKNGSPLYCGLTCAGMGRRKGQTESDKKEAKRLYDIKYRAKNRAMLKAKKAAYFQRTYDPEKAAVERKKIMPRHVEYCRQPEYLEWKRGYDRQHRAKKWYGPFWESHLLAMDIRSEALSRKSDYEIRLEKGTLGKTQQRKRDYEAARTHRQEPEIGPLGNLERGQKR